MFKKLIILAVWMELVLGMGLGAANVNYNLTLASEWGRDPYDLVSVSGVLACCAKSGESQADILNIGNPDAPVKMSTVNIGPIKGLALSENALCISVDGKGLYVFNVSDPAHPSTPVFYEFSQTGGVFAGENGYVYCEAAGKLIMFDCSNPSSPQKDYILDNASYLGEVIQKGNTLYVLHRVGILALYNITDPYHWTEMSRINVSESPASMLPIFERLHISGDWAFIAAYGSQWSPNGTPLTYWGQINIIDIRNKNKPTETERKEFDYNTWISQVFTGREYQAGDYFYFIKNYTLMRAKVDNGKITEITSLNYTPHRFERVILKNDIIYGATGVDGLRIFRLENSSKLHPAGFYDNSAAVREVGRFGDYYYLFGDDCDLYIMNLNNPANPILVRRLNSVYPNAHAVINNYLFVAGRDKKLRILNLANPENPTLLSEFTVPGEYYRFVVCGDTLAARSASKDGIDLFDISNPFAPRFTGEYKAAGQKVSNIISVGCYIYAFTSIHQCIIYQSEKGGQLTIAGSFPIKSPGDFAVSGSELLGFSDSEKLVLMDVSNPARPSVKNIFASPPPYCSSKSLEFSNGYGYLYDWDRIWVCDLRKRGALTIKGLYYIDSEGANRERDTQSASASGSPLAKSLAITDYGIIVPSNYRLKLFRFDRESSIIPPQIQADKYAFYFHWKKGEECPVTQTVHLFKKGAGSMSWSAYTSSSHDALELIGASSGYLDAAQTFKPKSSYLFKYPSSSTISINSPEAVNSPLRIYVTSDPIETTTPAPPFGEFATPAAGAVLNGSVAFTGWALAKTGIRDVTLYREIKGKLYPIGTANQVEGARPDVEALYPTHPFSSRAGWGYMMLTNMLPGGDGPFTIHVVASDHAGQKTTLGVKTVYVNNHIANRPFGAIDTPTQGGDASGENFVNFGWALTPLPKKIPLDGSSITVWVDGRSLGHPIYNQYREDVAKLFPGYLNSNGASGHFFIDTTKYEPGLHSIAWSVRDDGGGEDGVGSRYFNIWNYASGASSNDQPTGANQTGLSSLSSQLSPVLTMDPLFREKINSAPPCERGINVIRGYAENPQPKWFLPDETGETPIQLEELGRLEIRLEVKPEAGFQVINGQFRRLPPGSFLDKENGIFYWQPGPGFAGDYHLEFFYYPWSTEEELARKKIKVVISPRNYTDKNRSKIAGPAEHIYNHDRIK